MTSGVRASAAEIDRAIVDVAAWLFAGQGVERTSVQQIADATGYSKTGLLHRFPSKQAIVDAVERVIDERVAAITAQLAAFADPATRRRAALHAIAEEAQHHPGVLRFLLTTLGPAVPGRGTGGGRAEQPCPPHSTDAIVDLMLDGLTDPREQLQVVLALHLIAGGVVIAADPAFSAVRGELPDVLAELAGRLTPATDRAAPVDPR